MDTQTQKFKIRLGLNVAGGLALFVFAIFIIGKQKNLFNPVFELTASFYNISGLQVGNNVRFSGINVGTVDDINIINDSTVKVDILVKKEVKRFIKSDCIVAIGSEGLIGDRLLIITQGSADSPEVKEGQKLESMEPLETDAIMASLMVTAGNAEIISQQLAEIVTYINSGQGTLGRLIQDTIIEENIDQIVVNLKTSSKGLDENMEAAKHNFLLKGYFNKKEAAAAKQADDSIKAVNKQKKTDKKDLKDEENQK
jgi:phospholipid/cholesterol/gamma-HCH transport system substrate-binding protein